MKRTTKRKAKLTAKEIKQRRLIGRLWWLLQDTAEVLNEPGKDPVEINHEVRCSIFETSYAIERSFDYCYKPLKPGTVARSEVLRSVLWGLVVNPLSMEDGSYIHGAAELIENLFEVDNGKTKKEK